MDLPSIQKIVFTLFCFALLILTGCWDSKDIDRRAYVVALGIDRAEEESNRIQITMVISNPAYGPQTEGAGEEAPREIISFMADDFIAARDTANTIISKEVTYDSLTDIVISEKFASHDDFIRFIYDASKESEIRRDVDLIISKEDAYSFLINTKPVVEKEYNRYFKLIRERGQEVGMIPTDSQLLHFTRITEAGNDLFLATYATTETTDEPKPGQHDGQFKAGELFFKGEVNETQFAGSAVFKHGKMIGTMTGAETHIASLINDTLGSENLITSILDPFDQKYRITVQLNKKGKSDVEINVTNGTPTIDIRISLVANVLTNHSMTNYSEHPENVEALERHITDILEEKMNRFIKRTQDEFKANPFGWSLTARKQFLTNRQFEKFDWMKQYPDMDINLDLKVKNENLGRQSIVPDLKQ